MGEDKTVEFLGEKAEKKIKEEGVNPKKKKTTTKSTTKKTTTKKATTKKEKDVKEVVEEKKVEVREEPKAEIEYSEAGNEDSRREKISAGDTNCYCYFDISLTNASLSADVIEIAVITSSGKSFYGQMTDYDMKKVDKNVFETVIKELPKVESKVEGDHVTIYDTRAVVVAELLIFLQKEYRDKNHFLQFVTDKNIYKFSYMMDLLTRDVVSDDNDTLAWISPVVVDVNQDLATTIFSVDKAEQNYVPLYVSATILSRVDVALKLVKKQVEDCIKNGVNGFKSPLMQSAFITKALHYKMWAIEWK